MTDQLSNHIVHIQRSIQSSHQTFLFLDFDGTLIPFEKRPHDVFCPSDVTTTLTSLIHHPKFTIFIVTGRTLQDIKELLPLEGLSFVTLHGMEIELANGKKFFWNQAKNIYTILRKVKEETEKKVPKESGLYIEDKTFSLAFHYRLLQKEKTQKTLETIQKIWKNIDESDMLQAIHGEKVIELRPRGWDKGKAVGLLLENIPSTMDILPIYIGDDTTDEDAFKQLKDTGITVYVQNKSKKSTAAQYQVKDPNEVLEFLQSIYTLTEKI